MEAPVTVLTAVSFVYTTRFCFLSAPCLRTPTQMTLLSPRLLTCTRRIGPSMKQHPAAGHRSMPWDENRPGIGTHCLDADGCRIVPRNYLGVMLFHPLWFLCILSQHQSTVTADN
jgi:hypothetical protein